MKARGARKGYGNLVIASSNLVVATTAGKQTLTANGTYDPSVVVHAPTDAYLPSGGAKAPEVYWVRQGGAMKVEPQGGGASFSVASEAAAVTVDAPKGKAVEVDASAAKKGKANVSQGSAGTVTVTYREGSGKDGKSVTLAAKGDGRVSTWQVGDAVLVKGATGLSATGAKKSGVIDGAVAGDSEAKMDPNATYTVHPKNAKGDLEITKVEPSYPADYTGWKESGGKSYYYIKGVKQGTKGRGCEIFDGKAWYWLDAVQGGAKTVNKDVFIPYFYSNDSMNAGNQKGNAGFGKWVHYDGNGQMLKGWKKVNSKQYYFDPMTGEMAHGKCFLASGGKRVSTFDAATGVFKGSSNDLKWEYWYENGAKQGIQGRGKEIYDPYSKAWYWLDSLYNGKKAVNKEVMIPYTFQGKDHTQKWVRYDANGGMVKGWYKSGGKTWYYDKVTGAMLKGRQTIDSRTYNFDGTSGVLR